LIVAGRDSKTLRSRLDGASCQVTESGRVTKIAYRNSPSTCLSRCNWPYKWPLSATRDTELSGNTYALLNRYLQWERLIAKTNSESDRDLRWKR